MNYGLFYKQVTFNRDSIATVQKAIATATLEWEKGRLYSQETGTLKE
jgi:PKHD-type hydroxylase